jgi:hypothetical protein
VATPSIVFDAPRIAKVGESSSLAIVWIGVEFGSLSFKEGSLVAYQCRTFIDGCDIHDYHVDIRESRVMRQAGNRFLDPVSLGRPDEGTGGYYLAVTTGTSTSSLPGTASSPSIGTTTRNTSARTRSTFCRRRKKGW